MAADLEEGEELRPIAGYEGIYSVSSYGRVLRHHCHLNSWESKWLISSRDQQGYYIVTLHNRGRKTRLVHDLVIRAFKGPPPSDISGEYEVSHDDDDKGNNRPENLFWLTTSEHGAHSKRTGVFKGIQSGGKSAACKLSIGQAREARSLYSQGVSQAILSNKYGLSSEAMRKLLRGLTYVEPSGGVKL